MITSAVGQSENRASSHRMFRSKLSSGRGSPNSKGSSLFSANQLSWVSARANRFERHQRNLRQLNRERITINTEKLLSADK
jgi:hypothetical protein